MNLSWTHCEGGYCDLINLNLEHGHFNGKEGVYVIWRSGQNPAVVRLGQGIVKDRLGKHRVDPAILRQKGDGKLHATWAEVPTYQRDGVEKFLANALNPIVGDAFPQATPIPVNLPW